MRFLLFITLLISGVTTKAQVLATTADSLRGTINANRSWWNVLYYDLTVIPNIKAETISGTNVIHFAMLAESKTMQIDLQKPLEITSVFHNNTALKYTRNGNVYLIHFPKILPLKSIQKITISYKGKPRKAIRAPWDGGIVWETDEEGRPFINTACQGLGASVWWPCKDHQSDEPDSMKTTYIVPKNLVAVGNGRLRSVKEDKKGNKAYTWVVTNPINNYGVTMNIANYVNFTDTVMGEKGKLDMSYWVLDYNLEKAKKQFVQAKQTIQALEYWFGPYPFYEDSYKLIETHHLGMEHQSAVAYGNKYMNGYLGSDMSGSGWGRKWDYIIVHETGHEWFGNNITTNDIADMWIHEGFTDYCETLFTEYFYGKEAGNAYNKGLRMGIQNDIPIIGKYGVNQEGSGDMYAKGANIIHTVRQIINDDVKFRNILRGLNKTFYHKTINSSDVEAYISKESGIDFTTLFNQYLRTTKIPTLEYYFVKENNVDIFCGKFTNCNADFSMQLPIGAALTKDGVNKLTITTKDFAKLHLASEASTIKKIINPNIYIQLKAVKAP